ncbi:MAG: PPC domain-containing protein [Pseudomonadota bacterium]
MRKPLWAALLALLFLASCGGGGDPQAPAGLGQAQLAKLDEAACRTPSEAAARVGNDCLQVLKELAPQRALAPQAAPTLTASALFAWAQSAFPQFFAGAGVDGTLYPYTFRYYPATDTYLAVDVASNVYVLGPLSNYQVMYVGALSAFTCSVYPSSCEIPGDASTGYSLGAGNYVASSIDFAGDTDWFAISLTAGRTYTFDLQGAPSGLGTLADPILRLLSSGGVQVASNDDVNGSSNRESRIVYTPGASGTYYLSAQAYSSTTGSYRLSASVAAGGGGGGGGGGGSVDWNSSFSASEIIDESPTLAAGQRQGWTFTVTGGDLPIEVVFAAQYSASLYLMPSANLSACVNGGSFNYYTSWSFIGQYGYQSFTLPAGSYGVCMVNGSNSSNSTRIELQNQLSVTGFQYYGAAFSTVTEAVNPGGRLTQPVTAGATWRTFVDGANTGGEVYLIPASQQSAFLSGGSFNYITTTECGNGANKASPGLCEITGVGDYAIAYRNTTNSPQSVVMVGRNYVPN